MAESTDQATQDAGRSTQAPAHAHEVPRLPGHWFWGSARDFQARGPDFLSSLHHYGGVVRYRQLFIPIYLVLAPEAVRHVLQENYRNYDKQVPDYRMLGRILGPGLLTNDGDSWLRQRRLIQPAFHRQRLAGLGTLMAGATQEMLDRWEGLPRDETLDISAEMMRLTLRVVGLALFSTDTGDDAATIGQAFSTINQQLASYFARPFPPMSVPTRRSRALWAAKRELDAVVARIIAERRRTPGDRGDLLSMLLDARDAETGEGMSDEQVRSEVMTLLLAGHETTANALTWLWYLLSAHPAVETRLHEELARVLGGAAPSVAQLADLPYARMVIDETLRLYPPAWIGPRRVTREFEFAGRTVPAGAYAAYSSWASHHLPDVFPEPEEFRPERFTPAARAALPKGAYVPFGGGSRTCIGMRFGQLEVKAIASAIIRRFRLELAPGFELRVRQMPTIGPRGGLPVVVHER